LEAQVLQAANRNEKAVAYYELGLFHDNNSRERQAIPNYVKAISLGLEPALKAQALAWLASSLYKTGSPNEACARLRAAFRLTRDPDLKKFLNRLDIRLSKKL
jgi:tetratricopeptide (TPR) repeat protein